MKIEKLLDATKAALQIDTDGELARNLGVSKPAISDYYNGKRAPDDFACLKIAQALGKPLDSVIATVKAASEKDETRRAAWENYMKRLGGFAASVVFALCVTVTLIVTPTPANASPALDLQTGPVCIMLSALLISQVQAILRRVRQKRTFSVNVAWFAQMAT